MKKSDFIKYLTTEPVNNGKRYKNSTADERARFCETIEKEFAKDLDLVALDPTEREKMLANVKVMSRSHVNSYVKSLLLYYDFVDMNKGRPLSLTKCGMHFYINSTDFLPEEYSDIIWDLENEYETILGFGRNLLELDSSHLLKDSNIKEIERIPVVFRPEIKKSTYKADDDCIAEMLLVLIREMGRDITKKEISNILKNRSITDIIAGEFIEGQVPYIVIYYNAIKGNNRDELIAKVANVLAHEYMHYMEYIYCSIHSVAFYQNKRLSEAMADFFGVIYSIHRNTAESIITARKRYDLWKKRFHSCWPYSCAWLFYRVSGVFMSFSNEYIKYISHGSEKKFKEIFENSLKADNAYDMLNNL